MIQNCLFCKIVAGEIPASIVYQDENVTAFRDINPGAPVHVLIVPNQHVESLGALGSEGLVPAGQMLAAAHTVAQLTGVAESGYRVAINMGEDASLTVYHLHAHLIGGRKLSWPPG